MTTDSSVHRSRGLSPLTILLAGAAALAACQDQPPPAPLTGQPPPPAAASANPASASPAKELDCQQQGAAAADPARWAATSDTSSPRQAQAELEIALGSQVEAPPALAHAPNPAFERDLRARYDRYSAELRRLAPEHDRLSPELRAERQAALKSRLILGR